MRQEWCHGDNFNWRLFHAWLVQEYSNDVVNRERTRKGWLFLFLGEVMHEIVQRFRHLSIGGAVPSLTDTNCWLAFYLKNALRIRRRQHYRYDN